MAAHVATCLVWCLLHWLVAGRWRPLLAQRLGEGGFRGLFSVLSALALAAMIATYLRAPTVWLWPPAPWLNALAAVLMLPAFVLLVAALRPGNPTLAGPDMLLRGELPDRGITRVTRHPMLWAFALWALAHMAANGDLATLLLCGSVLLTALNGMASIDRKNRRRLGERYTAFERKTSILPFAAILQGRNEFRPCEIGGLALLAGVALYLGAFWLHGRLGIPISL